MNWKVLKTQENYKAAIKRTIEIFHTESGAEADELDLLLVLVKDYEDKHIQIPDINPIKIIKLKMKEQGMKAKDLEPLLGSKGHISSILSGRRDITLKTAQRLKNHFKLPAEIFFPKTELKH